MTNVHSKKLPVAALPTIKYLEEIAHQTLNSIPSNLKEKANIIQIAVQNYADTDTLKSLRIDDKYELLGLYRGTPIPIKKIFSNNKALPDCIFLYRCPLIRYSLESDECIQKLIRQVMMHELGHHFGYTPKTQPSLTNDQSLV